jgi:hypothetical protein
MRGKSFSKKQVNLLNDTSRKMIDIRTQPFTTDALTIRELKEILSVLPDTNEYGEDFEVWMSVGNNLSNVVKSVWSLNLRNDGCDIILECDN